MSGGGFLAQCCRSALGVARQRTVSGQVMRRDTAVSKALVVRVQRPRYRSRETTRGAEELRSRKIKEKRVPEGRGSGVLVL